VEVRLLGEVGIAGDDGRAVPVPGIKQRTVLALLALHSGRAVPVARLVDVGWGDQTPRTARRQVLNCVSTLRRLLGPAVVSVPSGYLLESVPIDLLRFEAGLARARAAAPQRPEEAVELLDASLALWRGPALGGTGGLAAHAARLDDMRLDAMEQRAELHLALGRHTALVPQLTGLVSDHPHREGLVAALMLALYRGGRQTDALDTYRRTVARLADELGIDPGPQLRQRHAAILRGDPALDPPATPAALVRTPTAGPSGGTRGAEPHGRAPVDPGQVRPAYLPAASALFVGRAGALRRLDALLPGTGPEEAAGAGTPVAARTAVISAVAGTAGIGKTTLALHWAHRVAARFPDGQLFVNLRGFDPAGPPMDPSEALRLFLGALGVPAASVPADRQAQVGLYRSLLAGRRVLVVLDNARDAGQVRPLLPGAPGCLTLVTSRDQLGGLVAGEGAHLVTLDLLPSAEARDLLARRLGPSRVAAEPRATDEIVAACARLPLALAVVAARAAAHPRFPLDALAKELRDAEDQLAMFDTADAAIDIRSAFACSYRAITPAAARLFRLLGLHPGPDVTLPAAASLAGAGRERVRPWLAELRRAHLVTEHVPGRYALHDLLRAYAADLAERDDAGPQRRAARRRLLDHYVHTAQAAGTLLHPHRDPIAPAALSPGVAPEPLADRPQALAWCIAEHRVLLALIRLADAHGFDDHCWQLAWTLAIFLDRHGLWHDLVAATEAALAAARRLGDGSRQARAHRILGATYLRVDRHEDAHAELRRALAASAAIGDAAGQAFSHLYVARAFAAQHRHAEALDHARRALDLHTASGHRVGRATALNVVGWYLALLGEPERARPNCEAALALHRETGDRQGEAATCHSLGYIHQQLGHHAEAMDHYRHALAMFQEIGDRHAAADTLRQLGQTCLAAGDAPAARTAWTQALDELTGLGHADAAKVRAQLAALDNADPDRPDPAAAPGGARPTGPNRPRAGRRSGRAARSAGR
jgi:DNA-binding SARP family transcriptional activator/tetratricopeptide (TPR) repeat protein